MSVFAARITTGASDWLSLGDGRYGNELRQHHHHHQQQQQQLMQATQSPRHANPVTFRDVDYAGVSVKPDPDGEVIHVNRSLNVDEAYRTAAARSFNQQRPDWASSPNSYQVAGSDSRRLATGQRESSLNWPIDRQRFSEVRDVGALSAVDSRDERSYVEAALAGSSKGYGDLRGFAGDQSPADDGADHRAWKNESEYHPSPQQMRESAGSDPYRTGPGHCRADDMDGLRLERSGEVDDGSNEVAGHYRPRQLLADLYRNREKADHHRRETAEPSTDQMTVQGGRWTKAASTYDGSPPAERESTEVTNFYNGRRQTWPLASQENGVPQFRRRYPHSASADQYLDYVVKTVDNVERSSSRQHSVVAAAAAAAAASPISQLIQRYDQHALAAATSADLEASSTHQPPATGRSDWMHWQAPITSGSAGDINENMTSISESSEFGNKTYSCHICSYIGDSKPEFDAHMGLHFDHRCPFCDYSSRTEGRLRCHIKTFHADGGLNCQGAPVADPVTKRKPKIITCQKCGFKAKEKEELWIHRRQQHMSADKVLECPRCPFATELRHHLEYHLRSHYGSRPYKCDKCTYRCYNQSMLNSHAKSHTNVYQFRCSDCQFAAKYCHSLKVHLKQNPTHRAAPVLNEDGSVPTDGSGDFEVISRRGRPRGPRASRRITTRPRISRPDIPSLQSAPVPGLPLSISASGDPSLAAVNNVQYADVARPRLPGFLSADESRLVTTSTGRLDPGMLTGDMRLLPTAFSDFVVKQAGHRAGAGAFQTSSSTTPGFQLRDEAAERADRSAVYSSSAPFLPVHMEVYSVGERDSRHCRSYSPGMCAERPVPASVTAASVLAPTAVYDDYDVAVVSPSMPEPEPALCGDLPLDLTAKSRPEDAPPRSAEVGNSSPDDVTAYRPRRHYETWSRAHGGSGTANSRRSSDEQSAGDSKDIGEADFNTSAGGDVKPEVQIVHAPTDRENLAFVDGVAEPSGPPSKRCRMSTEDDAQVSELQSGSPASGADGGVSGGRYVCSHCEIEFFGSRVLHAMHMAFHGPVDPFQCNQCGARTPDRIEFFLHLARVAHA